ncbi:hypothetical protein QL285_002199 [Trifolium repens]|nr:hypothetical protein QL285_002199 [Trifolium repens]
MVHPSFFFFLSPVSFFHEVTQIVQDYRHDETVVLNPKNRNLDQEKKLMQKKQTEQKMSRRKKAYRKDQKHNDDVTPPNATAAKDDFTNRIYKRIAQWFDWRFGAGVVADMKSTLSW